MSGGSSYSFDFTTVEPSVAVVESVSRETATHQADLPPLNDAIDPDALNTVCGNTSTQTTRATSVTFEYSSLLVTVNADGRVLLGDIPVE